MHAIIKDAETEGGEGQLPLAFFAERDKGGGKAKVPFNEV